MFNAYVETMVYEAIIKHRVGTRVNGERICSIKFANDQAITESSVKSLQKLFTEIIDTETDSASRQMLVKQK